MLESARNQGRPCGEGHDSPSRVATKNAKIAKAQTRMAAPAAIEITITMIAPLSIVILPPLAFRPGFQLLVYCDLAPQTYDIGTPAAVKISTIKRTKVVVNQPFISNRRRSVTHLATIYRIAFPYDRSVTGSISLFPAKNQSERAVIMNNQCVVYVTDVEYSFPTILSALQARKFASPATDVCVLMSEHLDNFAELKGLLAMSGVELIDATAALQDSLGKLDGSHFQGRISVSTMAKLVLCEVLPAEYTQIIYLDGDTQVVSDLAELENAVAPEGKFFAARDYTSIHELLHQRKRQPLFQRGCSEVSP